MIVFYYSPGDGIFCPGIPQLEPKLIAISFAPRDNDEEQAVSVRLWEIAALIRDRNTRLGVLREDAIPPTAAKLASNPPARTHRKEEACWREARTRYEKSLIMAG